MTGPETLGHPVARPVSYRSRLQVAIAAEAGPGGSGGVARFLGSLIHALGKLRDGDEEYAIVVPTEAHRAWLQPLLGPSQRIVFEPDLHREVERRRAQTGGRSLAARVKWALGPLLPAARKLQRLVNLPRQWPEVPVSDGAWELLGCDVLHIANQPFFLCAIPTVYNPHDLQHLHFPQFFSPDTIAWRETLFPAGCHFANTVVVGSQWVKDDVVRRYRVHPDKVQVIFEAPTTEADQEPTEGELAAVGQRYAITGPFALYPAMTWPHKNHIRLLEALALLRDRGRVVSLICTGQKRPDVWPHIERCIQELGLSAQVRFLGLVPDRDLKALFGLAQFLIFPTLLEAISLPIFEAWLAGLPVACSNITALPEQVGEAALKFDPTSVEAIAHAVATMAGDADLRRELRRLGHQRVKDFTWERTAKAYRAVYRRVGGFPLTEEDRWLLSRDPASGA
jgi:glycosyltransferase involved in cell wall biosynthesis